MNIFKYSRGHFFGTVLPGAFLLINILFIDPTIFHSLFFQENFNLHENQAIFIITGFILSYVIGVALRLMSPDNLELLALIIIIPKSILTFIFQKAFRKKDLRTIKQRVNISFQRYPYPNWFFEFYLPMMSKQHQSFYKSELEQEFNNDKNLLGRNFVNSCKTFIYKSSDGLSEEIMYNEGLVRFICGIIYSLLVVLILLLFHLSGLQELFFMYLIIIIVFLDRLRGVRAKEVVSILDGYMFLKSKKNN